MFSFSTNRLDVREVVVDAPHSELTEILACIPNILTEAVVENLPPYFHDIQSTEAARVWLDRMLSESRLLQIRFKDGGLIGFLFIHEGDSYEAHIGYLLAEEHWGIGLASELLPGFLGVASSHSKWRKIVGGVDHANKASAHVLLKLGFTERSSNVPNVSFYEYDLHH